MDALTAQASSVNADELKRRTERVADAKRLLTQAQSREQRIQKRIDEVTGAPREGDF